MTEAELRAQYEKDKAASAKRRKEGFMGQIVLPGEMPFEEYKAMRSTIVPEAIGTARPTYPNPNTLTGTYEIATGIGPATPVAQPVLGTVTNADVQPTNIVQTPGTYTIDPAVIPNNPMDGMTPEEQQQFLLNTLRSSDAGLNNMAEQQDLSIPAPPDTRETIPSEDFSDREKAQEAMAKIATGEAKMPEGTTYTATKQEVQPDELITYEGLGDAPEVKTTQVTAPDEVAVPDKPETPQIDDVPTIADDITEMDAVKGKLSDEATIQDVAQGVVSPESIAEAAQGKVSKEATVQYQISELMSSIEQGKPLPAWASGAARGATAMMQQRGLGSSSMASAAMVQALMEAGIPIAQADAQTYAAMDLANLNARQQTALTNAATYAAMDARNLDARLTAQVNNAKAFLTIDLQNLDNEQKAATLSYQYVTEAMFKDQSYEYAAEQFNAQTQAQVDQFFAELDVQVQTANANRVAAMNQFNAGEANAMTQFVAGLADARERFDVEMGTQIDQANALWRREINTANTALINEQNRINTQNLLNITQNAQNALWQKYADEAAFVFQMAESESNRQHQLAMLAMESKYNTDLYERQFELDGLLELGKNALKIWSD